MLPKAVLEAAKYVCNVSLPLQPRTPEERLAHAWQTSSGSQPRCVSNGPWLLPSHKIRKKSIRVKWFYEPTFPMIMDQRCLFAKCDLDEHGGLNLKSIRAKWGLSTTCRIIRYRRETGVKLFIPRNQDYLEPREVKVMKGDDECISIVEEPTEVELSIRTYRQTWVDRKNSLHTARIATRFYFTQSLLPLLLMFMCVAILVLAWPRLGWTAYVTLATLEILFVTSIHLLLQWVHFTRDEGPPPYSSRFA
ncbi:hypothetical protein PHLGIDRAFT_126628 [Phlebiopsis gigantea 11061_1 CR5-6]|uniref:Uncharacterized protein n=1 Tax=Phlebiopsis gigantea (strain 11061_1 CR5-6) TaxID=745531 RepID=A0A0C3SCQ9_PHLG1|nr:hypothetical protein PHLGIDRAFT_126628 [Phlebiopsis gigantea 11061_1 CR5-6]